MEENLNAHIDNLTSKDGTIDKLTSKDATIDKLTSEFLKLKQQIELLNSELKIVKNNTEIAKFSESRVEIKPTLNTNTINNSSTIDTSSLKSSNIDNRNTIKTQTLESTTIKGTTIYSNDVLVSVPIGTIVAFYGTSIPDGWALCDGSYNNDLSTNVPDLRGVFIKGANSLNDINKNIQGSNSVFLNQNNIPKFDFKARISFYKVEVGTGGNNFDFLGTKATSRNQSIYRNNSWCTYEDVYSEDMSIGNSSPQPISIPDPKHIKLAYIIKVK